jgi:hypothetical protein
MPTPSIFIARDGVVLGKITENEARELLEAGLLKTSDHYWTAGQTDWFLLSELPPPKKSEATQWLDRAKSTMATAGIAVSGGAAKLAEQMKLLTQQGSDGLSASHKRVLEDYVPQIKRVIAERISEPVRNGARSAMENDLLMTKTFGAVYDCLPKPICRFISEQEFIAYCLEHRRKLLE